MRLNNNLLLFSLMAMFRIAKTLQSSNALQGAFRRSTTTRQPQSGMRQFQIPALSDATCRNRPSSLFFSKTRRSSQQTRLYSSPPIDASTRTETYESSIAPESSNNNNELLHSTTSCLLEDLNPSQVEAVTLSTSSISRVLAGPGSGKTRVLTCRIAYLLEQDRHSKILAVTFTRKAAGEMQKRVESLLELQQSVEDELYGRSSNMNYQQRDSDGGGRGGGGDVDDEIEQETVGNVPRGLERVTLGTFHSICAKIMRYNGNLLADLPSVRQDMSNRDAAVNLDGSFAIIDQGDQLRIVRECLEEAEIDLKKSGIKPLAILNALSKIKEMLSQGQDPFRSNDKGKPVPQSIRMAKTIYGSYREKLFANNAVDFDDLIFMARELLMENRDLRDRLHKRWPHVLVDEYQDTSQSQMDLVKLLSSSSLFVVGDADQSIYSWRGAHAGSLQDFATEFRRKGSSDVKTVYLKENYRSTSNIVRAAEKVISSSGTSKSENDELRRSMKPKRGSGPPPRVIACADERAEANFVVDTILDMIDSASITQESTVAIIYRTNAQSRYLEEVCVQKNLPYVIRGGAGGFYKRAEVKDCLCFLRWLHNGNDEGSMLRAMKTPSKGIGDVALTDFKAYCAELDSFYREHFPETKRPSKLDVLVSITDVENGIFLLAEGAPEASVFVSKRALNNFIPFSRQMRAIRNQGHSMPVDGLLFYIIEELDLISHFDSISKSKSEFEERQQNVQELRQATKRYSNYGAALKEINDENEDGFGNESALGNFLDDVALVTDITGDKGSEDNRLVVNLMTIHASKGMEFDAVVVVGIEEGTLPSGLALQEGEGSVALEEEKRLCYVAMTRAKTQLILTWRKEVTNFSNWSDSGSRTSSKDRSRFLDALVSKKSRNKADVGQKPRRANARDADQMLRQRQSPSRVSSGSNARRSTQKAPGSKPSLSSRSYSTSTVAKPSAPLRHAATSVNGSPRSQRRPQAEWQSTRADGGATRRSAPGVGWNDARAVQNARKNGNQISTAPRGLQEKSIRPRPAGEASFRPSSPPPHNAQRKAPPIVSRSGSEVNKGKTREIPDFDSTWFFPVGSDVVHRNFGKGVVLQPPPPGESKEMLVRVQFGDGRTKEFPASGKDIVPDLGI